MVSERKRRAIILHGISATSHSDWYQAVGKRLSEAGYDVLIPDLPGTYAPNLDRWSDAIHQALTNADWVCNEDLTVIAHSTGVLGALRFVEGLPMETRLGPCIFVAGFPASLFFNNLPVLVARSPRSALIRSKMPKLLAVHSTNDWRVPLRTNSEWFRRELGAEILVVNNAGHFIRRHGWTDWNKELYETAERFLEFSAGGAGFDN